MCLTAARGRSNGRARTPLKASLPNSTHGRVWKTRQHRRATSAPLESCHEPGRSTQPLTGKFGAFERLERPSTHVRGRSARCRRSFSDAKSYRSQISFLFFGKGAESTGSLSDGPNPLLEDSFFFRRPFCAPALLALAAPQPASEGSHTGSPPTAIRALPTLSVAPQSRSVLVVQPPPGGCTTTRASAVRTSAGGQRLVLRVHVSLVHVHV